MKTIKYSKIGCLPSCIVGVKELRVGEEVNLFLDRATIPSFPEKIKGVVVAVKSVKVPNAQLNRFDSGREYEISYDETLLPSSVLMLEECNLVGSPVCISCCEALSERIDEVEDDVADIITTVNNFDNRITIAEGEIDTLQAADVALASRVSVAEGEIDALQLLAHPAVTKQNTPTVAITLVGQDIKADIVGASGALAGQVPKSDGAGGIVWQNDLQADLTTVNANIAALQAEDIAIDGRLDDAEDAINALEVSQAAQDALIAALQAADLSLDGRLDTAEGEIDALQLLAHPAVTKVDSNTVKLTLVGQQLKADIAGVDTALAGQVYKANGDGTASWQADEEGDLTALEGRVDTAESEIDALQLQAHLPVTKVDTGSIELTLVGQQLKADIAGVGAASLGQVPFANGAGGVAFGSLPAQSNDWTLAGNAGTNPATQFVGTTDAVDFNIRTNNVKAVNVDGSTQKVGIGSDAVSDVQLLVGSGDGTVSGSSIGIKDRSGAGQHKRVIYLPSQDRGDDSVFFGDGGANAIGKQNVGIGMGALRNLTGGEGNTVGGALAGRDITDGFENTLFGSTCGISMQGANRNCAFGTNTMRFAVNAVGNSVFGAGAGDKITSAVGNTLIGRQSGESITIGSNNTFSGSSSGVKTVNGSGNFAGGQNSLFGNIDGNNNVAISGSNLWDQHGSNKVTIGFHAGGASISQGPDQGQVLIGRRAGISNTAPNTTIVGSAAGEGGFKSDITVVGTLAGNSIPDDTTSQPVTVDGAGLITTTGSFAAFGPVGDYVAVADQTGRVVTIKITSATTADSVGSGDGNQIGTGVTTLRLFDTSNISNSSALGVGAKITASNQVVLGNGSTTAVVSTGSFTTISDENLKHSIGLPSHSSIDRLTAFTPKNWKYCRSKCLIREADPEIEDDKPEFKFGFGEEVFDREHFGYIAQEVESQVPQAVIDIGHGFKGVAESKIIPELHNAILELKAEIEALKARLDTANL